MCATVGRLASAAAAVIRSGRLLSKPLADPANQFGWDKIQAKASYFPIFQSEKFRF
jgi:hypothetical protein